jgi:putative ABC transport system permease protein
MTRAGTRAGSRPPSLRDLAGLARLGLVTTPVRTALSTAGVAIGIAVMVAVLGVSQSSRANLIAQIDRLGTNLLTVTPGRGIGTAQATLPPTAPALIARIGAVQDVAAIDQLDATARRSRRIDAAETEGVTVFVAHGDLLAAVRAHVARGRFLDPALAPYPTVVLGAVAAARLGIDLVDGSSQIWIADRSFTVVGILEPVPLAPELDEAALVGTKAATSIAGTAPTPTTIYIRTEPSSVPAVQGVLAATADPAHPQAVSITRPSDALTARAAANSAFTALFFGLAAVALFVGGLGIANVMLITVLERRAEVGLRRALGATRANITAQFLAESLVLSLVGAAAGTILGVAITSAWAHHRHTPTAIPIGATAAIIAVAALIGAVAGIYPATSAARLDPTAALTAV